MARRAQPALHNFADDLTRIAGPVDEPWGPLFWSEYTVGGLMQQPTTLSGAVVATLTLEVASVPGTYGVSLVDGFAVDTSIQPLPFGPGPAFEITVHAD